MKKKVFIIGMMAILIAVCTACTSESPDISQNDLEGRTLYYEIPHTDDMADPENKFIKLEESK